MKVTPYEMCINILYFPRAVGKAIGETCIILCGHYGHIKEHNNTVFVDSMEIESSIVRYCFSC